MQVETSDAVGESRAERPVLVVGAAGRLGTAMVACLGAHRRVLGWTRAELDLTDAAAVGARVASVRPSVIVNCAGDNDVDGAEERPVDAMEANAFAVLSLARAATATRALLVHYSSDFVFDGTTDRPYDENDRPAPQSVYAASKLLGEWFAARTAEHYVLRVESLFGGRNRRKGSLDRIIDALAAGSTVRAFTDRTVSPSFVGDVAVATDRLLGTRPPTGLYHCVNSGAATWYEIAMEVRRLLRSSAAIEPVTLGDVQLRAKRPAYCALSNDKLRRVGIEMPTWQDAVAREIADRRSQIAD